MFSIAGSELCVSYAFLAYIFVITEYLRTVHSGREVPHRDRGQATERIFRGRR